MDTIIALLASLAAVLSYLAAKRKRMDEQAAWQAVVNSSLLNVEKNTKDILLKVRESELRIHALECELIRASSEISGLKEAFRREKAARSCRREDS